MDRPLHNLGTLSLSFVPCSEIPPVIHRRSQLRTCALPTLLLLLGEACGDASDSASPSAKVPPFGSAAPGAQSAQPAAHQDDGSSTEPSTPGMATTGSESPEAPVANLPLDSGESTAPAATGSAAGGEPFTGS